MIAEGKPLKVNIEFSLQSPQGGIHFVVPTTESEQEKSKKQVWTIHYHTLFILTLKTTKMWKT